MDDNEIDKIDIGALFQFDQFKKLLEHLFTTQKALNNKIKELESKLIKTAKITYQSFNFIQMKINDFTGKQDVIPYLIEESNDNIKNQDQFNIDIEQDRMKNRSQSVTSNNALITSNSNAPLLSSVSSSTGFDMKHINIIIKMINSRLKVNEAKISELSKSPQAQAITLRHMSIIPNDKQICIDTERKVNYEKKISELEEMVSELKDKTKDFDLFDIFENVKEGDGNQIEMTKVLIKSLERKVFTKFGIVDEKIKQLNDETIEFRNNLQKERNNIGNSNNIKSNEDFDDFIAYYSKSMEEINDKLQSQPLEIQLELNKSLVQLEEKMSKELQEKESRIIGQIKALLNDSSFRERGNKINLSTDKIFDIENDTKALINKSIEESEKYLKSQIAGLNIENIKKDIQTLLKALLGKIEKKDLQDLYHKLDSVNDVATETKKQAESNKYDIDNINQMIERLVKKLEFVNGIVFSLQKQENTLLSSKEPHIDITKFITQTQMTSITSSHQADIDKVTKETESLRRLMSKIEDQMKTFATEGDVKNLEQCFINELDEYKISALKKFSDKLETLKNFKFVETQMKHYFDINGSGNGNAIGIGSPKTFHNKKDIIGQGGDWLIAKKPIGMFHCASCDSYIGELNNTVKYSPWNKIPMRDDIGSKYRVRIVIVKIYYV